MADYFISYSKKDGAETVLYVKQKLELDAGLEAWIDEYNIEPGEKWQRIIDNAIDSSVGMLVIVTPESLKSSYVSYEWGAAHGKGKPVIPLIFDKSTLDENPTHALFMFQGYEFEGIDDKDKWKELLGFLAATKEQKDVDPKVAEAESDLRSHDRTKWQDALDFLKKHKHPSATEALARLVVSDIPVVIVLASIALGKRTKHTDERSLIGYTFALTEYGGSYHSSELREVFNGLIAMNNSGTIKCIVNALAYYPHPHGNRTELIGRLSKIRHPDAVPVLLDLLNQPGTPQLNVIAALGELRSTEAVSSLNILLKAADRKGTTRRHVAEALGKIGHKDGMLALLDCLNTYKRIEFVDDAPNCKAIVTALGDLDGGVALEELQKLQNDQRFYQLRSDIRNAINQAINTRKSN